MRSTDRPNTRAAAGLASTMRCEASTVMIASLADAKMPPSCASRTRSDSTASSRSARASSSRRRVWRISSSSPGAVGVAPAAASERTESDRRRVAQAPPSTQISVTPSKGSTSNDARRQSCWVWSACGRRTSAVQGTSVGRATKRSMAPSAASSTPRCARGRPRVSATASTQPAGTARLPSKGSMKRSGNTLANT